MSIMKLFNCQVSRSAVHFTRSCQATRVLQAGIRPDDEDEISLFTESGEALHMRHAPHRRFSQFSLGRWRSLVWSHGILPNPDPITTSRSSDPDRLRRIIRGAVFKVFWVVCKLPRASSKSCESEVLPPRGNLAAAIQGNLVAQGTGVGCKEKVTGFLACARLLLDLVPFCEVRCSRLKRLCRLRSALRGSRAAECAASIPQVSLRLL